MIKHNRCVQIIQELEIYESNHINSKFMLPTDFSLHFWQKILTFLYAYFMKFVLAALWEYPTVLKLTILHWIKNQGSVWMCNFSIKYFSMLYNNNLFHILKRGEIFMTCIPFSFLMFLQSFASQYFSKAKLQARNTVNIQFLLKEP